jgi:hypothetical protein
LVYQWNLYNEKVKIKCSYNKICGQAMIKVTILTSNDYYMGRSYVFDDNYLFSYPNEAC